MSAQLGLDSGLARARCGSGQRLGRVMPSIADAMSSAMSRRSAAELTGSSLRRRSSVDMLVWAIGMCAVSRCGVVCEHP